MTRLRRPRSALLSLLRLVVALIILFEEWGWEPLQRAMARLAQLPVLRQLDAWVARLPPYAALVVFFVPGLLLLPVKLGAVWLMSNGQYAAGLALIIAAKVLGTAVAARLFTLTRPALMQLAWFARAFEHWTVWKASLLTWVRRSDAWRWVRALRLRVKQGLRSLFGT